MYGCLFYGNDGLPLKSISGVAKQNRKTDTAQQIVKRDENWLRTAENARRAASSLMDFCSECANSMALISHANKCMCSQFCIKPSGANPVHSPTIPNDIRCRNTLHFNGIKQYRSSKWIHRNKRYASVSSSTAHLLQMKFNLNGANGNDTVKWIYLLFTIQIYGPWAMRAVACSMRTNMWLCWWGRTQWRNASIWFELCQIIFGNLLQNIVSCCKLSALKWCCSKVTPGVSMI